ncbi:M15 family metallopeptidase [Paenibacillus albidus]|uniref:M15 family metallopeptidase n=1 Tax=Paenibacillus albidus TaxID=2041023 RepID=UPI001BE579F6|nr:M15 family metallopeptidase [Paenibacillus albidus]MBT2293260.1 M15 family metallopeptidase [Paenibacillus albidus]
MLTLAQVKNKSAHRLPGLHPVVLNAATLLIERCYQRGIAILITQGLRTIAEQDKLYAQGRTVKGAIVTHAKGGNSYHNYGLAADFALLLPDGKSASWDMKRDDNSNRLADWQEVAQEAKQLGFEWGGDWTRFKDYPHFQMTFGLTLTQLRAGSRPSAAAVEAANKLLNIKGGEELNVATTAVVKVNGVKIADGILDKGITYVPVRVLAEALGVQVGYDSATRTVELTSKR